MAIYHCSVKVISRGKGRSAVGASAYRSGEKIINERDGMIHDYTKKTGVTYTEVLTPDNAPEWAKDRTTLWNEVESVEKSSNSRLAREVEVALPNELTKEQNIELIREYAKDSFVSKGMVADIAIHDKGDGNPHAHIMLTTRPFNEDGSWGQKAKKEYILDKQGNKIKLKSGEYKSRKIDSVDWNQQETLEEWRANWAKCVNKHLERNGHEERIDQRSYAEIGLERLPTIHEGYKVRAMQKRGLKTQIGAKNQALSQENKKIELTNKQIALYQKQLEREKNNGRGNKGYGIGDQDTRTGGAIRRGETRENGEYTTDVDWSAVRNNIQSEGNRVPEQLGNDVTREIQQKVRAVKERTNRATGECREQDNEVADKQRPTKTVNKSRSFEPGR